VVAPGAVRLWAPVLLWATLIFTLSSFSKLPEAPPRITDKHAHVAVYAVLGALLVRALSGATWAGVTTPVAVAAAAVAALYGLSDELHQYFVPGREVSTADLIADGLGAVLAAGALRAWAIIRRRS